jgi:hypothetical protein
MILLDGRETLSAFRRDGLNERLGGQAAVTAAQVAYALDGAHATALDRCAPLLDASGLAAPMLADDVLVLPRAA